MTVILGIETSCDETSIALVKDGREVLSNIVRTQHIHGKFGGVVPDISSREHAEFIDTVYYEAIDKSGIDINKIDAISVVNGPGLIGSLMTGLMFAKGLSLHYNKPFIPVNHVDAHIYANVLTHGNLNFPLLSLVASGGHTSLFIVNKEFKTELIGKTIDDAAGEAFDKCAKMLKLGYPGGPSIEKHSINGNTNFHRFPRAKIKNFDFSFSGLKTSVLYYLNDKDNDFINENLSHITASLQEAIVDQLINKVISASEEFNINILSLAGGVSANIRLRDKLKEYSIKTGKTLYVPKLCYCTDNAANVAGIGFMLYQKKGFGNMKTNVYSRK